MEHEQGSCGGGNTRTPPQFLDPNQYENYFCVISCHATILSALCFFSPHSPAVSVRTQAAHWLPLALLGGEKKIMQNESPPHKK